MICLVPPFVELTDGQVSSLEVDPGDNLALMVSISGFNLPLTSITWRWQDSALIGTEDRVTITNVPTLPVTTGPVLSTLLFRPVLPQDSGNYFVSAANAAGNNTAMFMLTVKGKSCYRYPQPYTYVQYCTHTFLGTYACISTGMVRGAYKRGVLNVYIVL